MKTSQLLLEKGFITLVGHILFPRLILEFFVLPGVFLKMVKEGDFVSIKYAGSSEGKVFDTNVAEEAKKAGLEQRRKYSPLFVVAGKGQVVPGFDEALLKASEGKDEKASIPAAKAYGQANKDLVRLIPIAEFKKQGVTPYPGMVLNLDDTVAKVVSVESGRVKVDFNHPLAGKDLDFSFKIVKCAEGAEEKLRLAVHDLLDLPETAVSFKEGVATVKVDASVPKLQDYLSAKYRFVQVVLQYVPDVKRIVFEEEFAKADAEASK